MTSRSPAKRLIIAGRYYMKKIALTILIACFIPFYLVAQNDSCNLQISLLTCGPGEDLYSVFGHSALRVTDKSANTDVIFNYGTFDFDDPEFYSKFVNGKLLYYVSVENFGSFVRSYQLENRSIVEQRLKLSCAEKQKLYEALIVNAREENKYYEYEFLFDNCSTRLRDIVANNSEDSVEFRRIIPQPAPTFRNMLHAYLFKGEKYWSAFGIDLLLASRIDRAVKNEEAMFLPDYLMKGFDSSLVRRQSFVQSKNTILESEEKNNAGFSFTPMMATIGLLLVGLAITFLKGKGTLAFIAPYFDGLLFFILGIMGCLMLYMWYGTEHELCRNNYNLYWALPTHIIAAFVASRNTSFIRKYFSISAILCAVVVLCWPFLPQEMNAAFFPLVLLSGIRSYDRSKKS